MNSVLTAAAQILAMTLDDNLEAAPIATGTAQRRLALSHEQTGRLLQGVVSAGFIEIVDDEIRPTLVGISFAAILAASRRQVLRRQMRLGHGPYWTYRPQEVNLAR